MYTAHSDQLSDLAPDTPGVRTDPPRDPVGVLSGIRHAMSAASHLSNISMQFRPSCSGSMLALLRYWLWALIAVVVAHLSTFSSSPQL